MFFISKPDFELHNFSTSELAEISFQIAQDKNLDIPSLEEIKAHCVKANSANEFFDILHNLSQNFLSLSKGRDWGSALLEFARENPLSQERGSDDDRTINRIVRLIYQCLSISYDPTRRKYKTDPNTGKLIGRVVQNDTT